MSPTKETLLAWQNRPQRLVAKFIKEALTKESPSLNGNYSPTRKVAEPTTKSPTPNRHEHLAESGRLGSCSSRSTSESSLVGIESYEDELNTAKKFLGKSDGSGNRTRIDSMSQVTGVRYFEH